MKILELKEKLEQIILNMEMKCFKDGSYTLKGKPFWIVKELDNKFKDTFIIEFLSIDNYSLHIKKDNDFFQVYTGERGLISIVKSTPKNFENESSACYYFIEELKSYCLSFFNLKLEI